MRVVVVFAAACAAADAAASFRLGMTALSDPNSCRSVSIKQDSVLWRCTLM
jgi:hypothetical protein